MRCEFSLQHCDVFSGEVAFATAMSEPRRFCLVSYADLTESTYSTDRCLETLLISGIVKPFHKCPYHNCHGVLTVCKNNNNKRWDSTNGYHYQCNSCHKTKSIKYNSIMAGSSKPLATWIYTLYSFTDKDKTQQAAMIWFYNAG